MPFKVMTSYTLLTVFSYVFQGETRKSVGCVFHEMPSFLCDCLFSVTISTVKNILCRGVIKRTLKSEVHHLLSLYEPPLHIEEQRK